MRRLLLVTIAVAAISLVGVLRTAGAAQLVVNGDFESGASPWQTVSRNAHTLITSTNPHAGSFSAQFCGTNSCSDQISQVLTLPSGFTHAVLSYWVFVSTQETAACGDALFVRIGSIVTAAYAAAPKICDHTADGVWTQETIDLGRQLLFLAGKPARLSFQAITNGALPTTFYVDDVQLNTDTSVPPTKTPTPTPTPSGGGSGGTLVSSDPFANPIPGQHHSEVEPDTFAYGGTMVAAFQVGRFYNGGSTDIGWARFENGTWQNGLLPGLTANGPFSGPYARASDPSVAYDADQGVWLIASLDLTSAAAGAAISVNRSADGAAWSGAVTVSSAGSGSDYDKEWIACDNTATSPYYGHCYLEWDDNGIGDVILMSASADGGKTWSAPREPAGAPRGLGGQPVVQPSGRVIVPAVNESETEVIAFSSSDGGATWGPAALVAGIASHDAAGGLRTEPLPSAEIDADGTVFVAWQDCRFEAGCAANDIVYARSADGSGWSAVQRVPIDPIGSRVDHFIPGLAVSPDGSGGTGRLALTYYYYPIAACGPCQLDVGYVTSTNGGASWSAPVRIGGPMQTSWLPSTNQGVMVADYMSTSFLGAQAVSVFPVASAPVGGVFNQPMYAATETVGGGSHTAATRERMYAFPSRGPIPVGPLTSR